MMRCLLFLLLLPSLAAAASATWGWQFPRDYTPAPDRFLLTFARATSQDVLTVPLSASGACGAGTDITEDTYCTLLPECPTEGLTEITVQAEWEALGRSAASAASQAQCVFSAQMSCQCLAVLTTIGEADAAIQRGRDAVPASASTVAASSRVSPPTSASTSETPSFPVLPKPPAPS